MSAGVQAVSTISLPFGEGGSSSSRSFLGGVFRGFFPRLTSFQETTGNQFVDSRKHFLTETLSEVRPHGVMKRGFRLNRRIIQESTEGRGFLQSVQPVPDRIRQVVPYKMSAPKAVRDDLAGEPMSSFEK